MGRDDIGSVRTESPKRPGRVADAYVRGTVTPKDGGGSGLTREGGDRYYRPQPTEGTVNRIGSDVST